jgi:phosphomethylpyrimidine synthase
MTLIEHIIKGNSTDHLKKVSEAEQISADVLAELVRLGRVVIPLNNNRGEIKPCGIGEKLATKVNVNIGTSQDFPDLQNELEKADISVRYGADTLMDLSTGGDLKKIRALILERAAIPLGTVPIYEAAIRAMDAGKSIVNLTEDDLFNVIEDQAREGVDFMTVHAGLTSRAIEHLRGQGRIADIVSRGGSFHLAWILQNGKENPLYEKYDRLLDIAADHDVTLSLGDGMRPGAIADATDRAQIEELLTLGNLVQRARERHVQVMVEGPGHVPLDQVEMNVTLQKRLCEGAPFYVLGPLVTDIAPGYDHIVGAIGGALAAASGADFLCYVTPAEHLGLPTIADVKEGLIASKIAAHAADLVKGVKGAMDRDRMLSKARKDLDWEEQKKYVLDPHKFETTRALRKTKSKACSMCGEFCAMRIVSEFLSPDGKADDVSC